MFGLLAFHDPERVNCDIVAAMRRREFVVTMAAAAHRLEGAGSEPQTFVYKTAGDCEIKADVHGVSADDVKPAVVWLHGGALIMGSRRLNARSPLLQSLLGAGLAVISVDYRLAPETKLPAIIEDVRDAFRWVRSQASLLHIDVNRIGACGGSAGGYLTLMTGFWVDPRPKALVSYWGYGDIVGPWYSRPDPFYLKQPAVSREEALAGVGRTPISEEPGLEGRRKFYLYCRQQGIWPNEVAGRDPRTEDRWFAQYCPVRHVTGEYPPTMLIHGTADTDVPHQQSIMMAEQFRKSGVKHELISVPEGGHGLNNIDPAERERIYRRAAAFLSKHV